MTLEHPEQVALMDWAKAQAGKYPELELLYANVNAGKRSIPAAMWAKAEGLKSGVPDLTLPVPRGGYHGMYIEMKVGRNKPSANQAWWLEQLKAQGYYTVVCYSCDEATQELLYYLGLTRPGVR